MAGGTIYRPCAEITAGNAGPELRGGPSLEGSTIRVLIVEDYAPWRRFICSMLEKRRGLRIVGEVLDGFLAVQKAQELQPDLILLDIGLPTINGIEAARRIRDQAPNSKILFVTENRCSEVVQEALRTGALGYVAKSDAATELLPAVEAVRQGKQFVSPRLAGQESTSNRS